MSCYFMFIYMYLQTYKNGYWALGRDGLTTQSRVSSVRYNS